MSLSSRAAWRLFETIYTRPSQFCRHIAQKQWRQQLGQAGYRRLASTTARQKQQAAGVHMDQMRAVYKQRNRTTMFYTLSIILGTVAFSYGSVPLYKMVRLGVRSIATKAL